MERILLLEDDKSLVTGLTAALLAAECAAWAVCPALCLPLLGLFVLLSAGTYAASGLLVGVAAGLVLHRALYTRLITHYFGVVWRVPFGLLAVLCLFVAGAAALAVHGPVKRLQAMPVTAAINELCQTKNKRRSAPFCGNAPALLGVTQSSTGMSSPNSSGRNRGQTFSVMEITEAARRLPISQEAGRFLP